MTQLEFRHEVNQFQDEYLKEVFEWEPKVTGELNDDGDIAKIMYSVPGIGMFAWVEFEKVPNSVVGEVRYYYFLDALVCKIDTENLTVERF